MAKSTELLKNGLFDSGSIDFMTNWFIPTDWEASWNDRFYGTLKLESVGAVYNAANALLLNYTPSDDEWSYDIVYGNILPPGVCQIIDLRNQNLSNIDHFTFSMNARLNFDTSPCKVDVIFYKATSDDTSYSFDASFEDYEILASIDIKESPTWNHITFDIDAVHLPKGVYKIYIAPHIDITDIQYENIIESTNVIIDDVSFLMVEQTDDGIDLDDTGFIKNGSFSIWVDGMPKYWDLINMDVLTTDEDGDTVYEDHTFTISQTNEYERNSSLKFDWGEDGYGYYVNESRIMPGLYQPLDLSEYEYGAEITLNYSIRRDTNNYSYLSSNRYGVDLYIYEASYIESTGEYVPIGGLFDYLYTRNPEIKSNWTTYTDTITLNQGYYLIGFTSELKYGTVNGVEKPRTYNFHAVIDDIWGEIKTTVQPEITYGDIILNGSFESQLNSWDYEKIAVRPAILQDYTDRAEKYPAYKLGFYYCNLYYESGILEEDKEYFHYGLKQRVLSKVNADAFFSFWHNTKSSTPLTFKVCIYETGYHVHDDTYYLVEPPMFEETITTSNVGWNNYASIVSLKYNTYYTVVFYPSNNNEATLYGINLDKISLASFGELVLSETGAFENPFSTSYGFLKCNLDTTKTDGSYTYSFYPYNPNIPNGEYFIKIPLNNGGIHYICTNGKRDESGFLLHYSNEMVQSPSNLEGMRYFFEDGHMAIDTTFVYNGKSYIADETGALQEYILDIDYINISPDVSPIIINTDQTKTITLVFNEQAFPCTLNIEISNTTIATVTGITKGISSNEVQILGKKMGETTLRAYITNPDGAIIEKIFKIEIKDELPEEYKDAKIYIPYDENSMKYSASYYSTLQVNYYILPEYLSGMPIEWTSSNTSVAVVDMNGLILAKGIGDCTITATNAYSGESVSFTLHVLYNLESPFAIRASEYNVSLAIGETKHITTKTFGSSSTSIKGVSQDVKWESRNTNIATVNKYGYITGVDRGATEIVCRSMGGSATAIIQVTVTGAKIELQDIELDCYSIDFNAPYKGKSVKIRCRPVPSNATNSDVIWASSNEDLVRVTEGGYVYVPFEYGVAPSAYITCTSKSRPDIVKTCEINFSPDAKSDGMIMTTFDTDLNTCIGRTLRIDYDYFINHKPSYGISYTISVTKTLDVIMQTPTTVTVEEDSYGKYINFVASEVGTYYVELKLFYDYDHSKTMSKIFTVHVYEEDAAPILKNDLTVLYALQNDSCILRCRIEDQIDELRDVNFFIDFNDGNGYEAISAYFEPSSPNVYQYFFISGYQLTPGTAYQVKIKAIDSQGFETTTNVASLTIPLIKYNHKEQLGNAKKDYDSAINNVLNILNWLISPTESIMPASYKAEFFVSYKIFCYNYENLRDMLDQCIKVINSQIGTSQAEIASFSNTLSSGGVSIASYSEGDYTNSNYQNITDMDYYQNECIKQLVARVLELEARLDELTNNNN